MKSRAFSHLVALTHLYVSVSRFHLESYIDGRRKVAAFLLSIPKIRHHGALKRPKAEICSTQVLKAVIPENRVITTYMQKT